MIPGINNSKSIQTIYEKYLKVCSDAVSKEEVFKTFKSNPDYTEVLEHCSYEIGNKYLTLIMWYNFQPKPFTIPFQNDTIGNPKLSQYGNLNVSPTTLQYMGVATNLIRQFKELSDYNIIEIGGGYGGQCKIMQDYCYINSYTIIDLHDPLYLQEKYLRTLNQVDKCNFLEHDDYKNYISKEYDLIISNYALSEMPREVQLDYVKNVCLISKHGYITCNDSVNGMELIKEKFSTFNISPDIEGERKTNFIITW